MTEQTTTPPAGPTPLRMRGKMAALSVQFEHARRTHWLVGSRSTTLLTVIRHDGTTVTFQGGAWTHSTVQELVSAAVAELEGL